MVTTIAPWSEVAGTYDIDFGQAIPFNKPTVRPRGFFGDVVNIGKDVLNAAQGNLDTPLASLNFNVNVGSPGQKTQIYKNEGGSFEIDCVDCYVTGSWHVDGHISVSPLTFSVLTLQCIPRYLHHDPHCVSLGRTLHPPRPDPFRRAFELPRKT